MFLRHRLRHFQPPTSKFFIAFQQTNVKNRRHIVNFQFNLPSFALFTSMYGWLISGAPAPAILYHLLKVRKFHGTSFLVTKGKKIKIKRYPPASFSEKNCLRNILLIFFWPWMHVLFNCLYIYPIMFYL